MTNTELHRCEESLLLLEEKDTSSSESDPQRQGNLTSKARLSLCHLVCPIAQASLGV